MFQQVRNLLETSRCNEIWEMTQQTQRTFAGTNLLWTCCGETGVTNLGKICYEEVASLLQILLLLFFLLLLLLNKDYSGTESKECWDTQHGKKCKNELCSSRTELL